MLDLKLGLRSFLRHRVRSGISAAAVSLGLCMLLLFVGIADDAHRRMAELGIRLGSGSVLVEAKGYRDTQTLDHVIGGADRLARELERFPDVQALAVRLRTNGLIASGEHSAPVLVSGVEPERELGASDLASARLRTAGRYLRPRAARRFQSQAGDVYLGQKLAGELGVAIDDRVVLTLAGAGSAEPASAAFVVCGLFRTGVDDLDGGYVEIPIEDARTLLHLPGAATELALLSDLDRVAPLVGALRAHLQGRSELSVVPWQEALHELHEALLLDDAGLYSMMLIVFLVVALGIFNTLLMSVSERTREFGVMLALGTAPFRLFRVILAEALVLCAVSIGLGLGLGLGLNAYVGHYGIDMTALTGEVQFAGVAWSGRVYSHLGAGTVAEFALIVGAIVLLSALYPALRVLRLEPVEAMHHV